MQTTPFSASQLASRMKAQTDQGLQVVVPGATDQPSSAFAVKLGERLAQWLLDLRLLRHVPLPYLVPDPSLLPPESIRFFHVDPTWVDRVIDGVMAAGDIGTLDTTFKLATMTTLRTTLDQCLGLDAKGTMTGMLIRSQLVARWPDVIVRALGKPGDDKSALPVLRKDTLSKSILIALFNGVPAEVQLREPHVGLRFGVETLPGQSVDPANFEVPKRTRSGAPAQPSGTIPVPVSARRVLDVDALAQPPLPQDTRGSRDIAIKLIRPPFVQRFLNDLHIRPDDGSQLPPDGDHLPLSGGRKVIFSSSFLRRRGP